jgi:hypothetical protein
MISMLSDDEMVERMANGWRMGKPFTDCGNGSTLAATANIRQWLPRTVAKYGIQTLNDAGAGDMAWLPHMAWQSPITYRPFDLIPRRVDVERIDITRDRLPVCDAILCRMVLNHLDAPRVAMALDLFRQSARYLIATQYAGDRLPQRSIQFQRLDLRVWLGEPREQTPDGLDDYCHLAIWAL